MNRLLLTILLALVCFTPATAQEKTNQSCQWENPNGFQFTPGKWSRVEFNNVLSVRHDCDLRIAFLSKHFLGTSYKWGTMIGGPKTKEELVIQFELLDCFTYLDTVEAARSARNFRQFVSELKKVRYKEGRVAYQNRNHFFTDWITNNAPRVSDVTATIGGSHTKTVTKNLNVGPDGNPYVKGLSPKKPRKINYIPSNKLLDLDVVKNLKNTGLVYVGFYTKKAGLDVGHVGIVFYDGQKFVLRHGTSSKSKGKKLLDEDFFGYVERLKNVWSGVIFLKPKKIKK